MKTVAIATQKGGEGKTTTAIHLAFAAAEQGKRVLFVDFDTQGNSTLIFTGGDSRHAHQENYQYLTASDLFITSDKPTAKPLNVAKNIDLIAPNRELRNHIFGEVNFLSDDVQAPRWVLSHFADDYDICIIDAPPAFGQVVVALLTASDYVISPLTIDVFALDGTAELLNTIDEIKQHTNESLKHIGIVPNKVNTRSSVEMQSLQSLRDAYGALITPFSFTHRFAVKMAMAYHKPVWQGARGSSHRAAAIEWKTNCTTILKEIF